MESSHISLIVSFKKMCLQGCLEDTDCCTGSMLFGSVFQAFAADTVNDRAPHEFLDLCY